MNIELEEVVVLDVADDELELAAGAQGVTGGYGRCCGLWSETRF